MVPQNSNDSTFHSASMHRSGCKHRPSSASSLSLFFFSPLHFFLFPTLHFHNAAHKSTWPTSNSKNDHGITSRSWGYKLVEYKQLNLKYTISSLKTAWSRWACRWHSLYRSNYPNSDTWCSRPKPPVSLYSLQPPLPRQTPTCICQSRFPLWAVFWIRCALGSGVPGLLCVALWGFRSLPSTGKKAMWCPKPISDTLLKFRFCNYGFHSEWTELLLMEGILFCFLTLTRG